MKAKTKSAIVFFVLWCILLGNACLLHGCGKRGEEGSPDGDAMPESELERAKRIVEKELSYLAPMYDDIEPLKYG